VKPYKCDDSRRCKDHKHVPHPIQILIQATK
jgi:hypothetical protein